MRLALVHDWLTGLRGGERVLDVLARRYPDADLYTLIHVPGTTSPAIDALRIRQSPLGHVPGIARHYRRWLPIFPAAARRLHLDGYDAVVSVHHAVAKSAHLARGTPHLCYCLTPMRYVWDQSDLYLGRGWRRHMAHPLMKALRAHDVRSSRADRVTRFAAISTCVRDRIRQRYGRDARVIAPPVDTETFRPSATPRADFYLLVSGFVPYKRETLAIEAFGRSGRRLVVVGDGPGRAALAARAPANVEFTGRISDAELAGLYAHCRALVFPQEEDFGLIAVEAQAAGRPVIAYGAGGALDTVLSLGDGSDADAAATGVFFREPEPEALEEAIAYFERNEARFDPAAIRRNALRFSEPRFLREFESELERTIDAGRRSAGLRTEPASSLQ